MLKTAKYEAVNWPGQYTALLLFYIISEEKKNIYIYKL